MSARELFDAAYELGQIPVRNAPDTRSMPSASCSNQPALNGCSRRLRSSAALRSTYDEAFHLLGSGILLQSMPARARPGIFG